MRLSRLYLSRSLRSSSCVELDESDAHYVRTVLRLKEGAGLLLFNGQGGEFSAVMKRVNRKSVLVEVGRWQARDVESVLDIELGIAVSRGERMDFSVQKAVELGVARIVPLATARCVVQFEDQGKASKCEHWRRVAESAAEQCGRTSVPAIPAPLQLLPWLSRASAGTQVLLDPEADMTLPELPAPDRTMRILVGAEGGLTEVEHRQAVAAGFIPVRLGPRILRTETASIAALAAIQTLWGDFSCAPWD